VAELLADGLLTPMALAALDLGDANGSGSGSGNGGGPAAARGQKRGGAAAT
jgi:hypothetical protein